MRDALLLQRLRREDAEALETLTERYRSYVCTVLSNMLLGTGGWADVEELCSDVFLALWEHAAEIGEGKLKPWLGTVARNRAKNWLRTRRELPMDFEALELSDGSPGLEDEAIRQDLAAAVRRAVDGLRPTDRELVVRYYYYLQPTEVIAEAMSLAPSSVRSRLSRARETLRKRLRKEGRP